MKNINKELILYCKDDRFTDVITAVNLLFLLALFAYFEGSNFKDNLF